MWHSQFKRPTECAHHKRRLRKTWTGCNQGAGKCASCNAASRAAEGLGTCGCRPMRARTGPWRRRLGGRSEAHWPGQRRTHRNNNKSIFSIFGGKGGQGDRTRDTRAAGHSHRGQLLGGECVRLGFGVGLHGNKNTRKRVKRKRGCFEGVVAKTQVPFLGSSAPPLPELLAPTKDESYSINTARKLARLVRHMANPTWD